MPLATNSILRGRYQIHSLLGQGGFGTVYRAWDLNLSRWCAVKENLDSSIPAQHQFQREVQMLTRVRHPSLPQILDYFIESNGQQYLIMEFVEGTDLFKLVQQRGALSEAQAIKWITQILDALEYLHSQNPPIVHRDVKPDNIIITPQNRAILVDFGIAMKVDPRDVQSLASRVATSGYSPPEQYAPGGSDKRIDLYAVGATLYFALTVQTPPDAIDRVFGTSMSLPSVLNSALSHTVEHVILRAMALRPQDRFQSAVEMRAAISPSQYKPEV